MQWISDLIYHITHIEKMCIKLDNEIENFAKQFEISKFHRILGL